jgi:hypothetical protein
MIRFAVLSATILLLPGTALAQDALTIRTLPIDPSAAENLLRDPDRWRWLREDHPNADVVFTGHHEVLVAADGTHGVIWLEADEGVRGATLARCSVTAPDKSDVRARDEARNLCDQIAGETMPRMVPLPGYWYQIVIADVVSGPAFPFVSPIIHLVHRRPLTALVSLGLRLGAVGGGLLTGLGIAVALPPQAFEATGALGGASPDYLPQMFVGMLVGAATGVVAATIFDAAYLARPRYGLPAPAWQF